MHQNDVIGRVIAMTVLRRDTDHHTYADYLSWSRTYGDELIDGTAYVREPPSPSASHQIFVVALCTQAAIALRGRPCRVFVAPFDVRLPKGTEADAQIETVVQPDVLIVSNLQQIDGRGLRGAPDWAAEVLSPSTAIYDQTIKLRAYERAAVPELWLIDPIDRRLKIYRLEARQYGPATVLELEGKTALTAVPGVTIDWDEVLRQLV
jgi:Uma2 family endonuclease